MYFIVSVRFQPLRAYTENDANADRHLPVVAKRNQGYRRCGATTSGTGTIGRRLHKQSPPRLHRGGLCLLYYNSSNNSLAAVKAAKELFHRLRRSRTAGRCLHKKRSSIPDGLFCFYMDGNGLHPTLAVPEIPNAHYRSRDFDRGAQPCSLYPPQAALAGLAHPKHGS